MIKVTREMNDDEFNELREKAVPSFGETFMANVSEGFDQTTTGMTINSIQETIAGGSDVRASDEQAQENIKAFYDKREPQVVDENSAQLAKPFTEEDWVNSPYYRKEISFDLVKSEGRAKHLAEGFDERKIREEILAKGNTGGVAGGLVAGGAAGIVAGLAGGPVAGLVGGAAGFAAGAIHNGGGFVAQMLGGLPDPINMVPMGMGFGMSGKLAGKVAAAATEGAISSLAVSAVSRPYWEDRGGPEATWQDFVSDVFVGGALGGGFGLAGHGLSMAKERRTASTMKDRADAAKIANEAIGATLKGDPVNLEAFNAEAKKMYDLFEQERTTLVQLRSEELELTLGLEPEKAKINAALQVSLELVTAREMNMTHADFVEQFGATHQRAEFNDGEIKPINPNQEKIDLHIDNELQSMLLEVDQAEINNTLVDLPDGTKTRAYDNSFPEWYRETGAKNKADFRKIVESKKGKRYERLKALAQERLLNGYESKASGRVEPLAEFATMLEADRAGDIPMGEDGQPLFQAAYHGSPNKFDKFSTEKIGVGEGSQHEGWGLYFTSEKEVAEWYRESYKGEGSGQTFKVEIPEAHEFLDREALLSDQPGKTERAKAAISEALADPATLERMPGARNFDPFQFPDWDKSLTGAGLYDALSFITGSDEAASRLLLKHEIPGLKYKGGKSTPGIKSDHLNYVLFDDSKVKIEETYYKKEKGETRGAIQFPDNSKAVISLFKSANESTLAHESMHLVLKNYQKIAQMPNPPARIVEALDTLKKWADSQPDDPKLDADANFQEKVARGWEQYLREGKAPVKELQGVFDRFREWLTTIYKNSRDLGVEISPEARRVFDRMLALDPKPDTKPIQAPDITPPRTQVELEADISATPDESLINHPFVTAQEKLDWAEISKAYEVEETELNAILGVETKSDTLFQNDATPLDPTPEPIDPIIDDFNKKLQEQEAARNRLIEIAVEKKELKRQAYLSLTAREKVAGHVSSILSANGTPNQAFLSLIEGDSSLRGVQGAGRSVDGHYTALAQSTSTRCFSELRKLDPKIEKLFENDMSFNQNVLKEMIGPGTTGDELAGKAAEIFKRYNDELVDRANLAGANINKLEGWAGSRSHDTDKMVGNRAEWKEVMFNGLDHEKSFKGLSEPEIREALDDIFISLITDNHPDKVGVNPDGPMIKPPRNIAKGLGKHRSLHFKSAELELAYLRQFGQGDNILEAMSRNIERMSRTTALMETLGPNPESTIAHAIEAMRDKIKLDLKEGRISDEQATKMLDDMGDLNKFKSRDSQIGLAVGMALGENDSTQGAFKTFSQTVRAINSLSKLGSALLSQPGDAIHAINERRIVSENHTLANWMEYMQDYFKKGDPAFMEIIEHTGIYIDAMNSQNYNRFEADNINGRLARMNDKMFRWSGQNWHVRNSKKAAAISLTRELGANIGKSWSDVHKGLKETLVQYGGFTEAKWKMLQLVEPEMHDGKAYYHPGLINKIDDSAFNSLIPEQFRTDLDPSLRNPEWEASRAKEIKRARQNLEMDLKTFFVEEGRNAAPEPDAKVKRVMSFGAKQGTKTHEAYKLFAQFKTFAFVNYDRSIKGKRMMRDSEDYGGLVHHAVATLMLGYASGFLKDLAKGNTPADPKLASTWGRAAMQSGGLGIFGDFFGSAYSARSGSDVLSTLAGPTVSSMANISVLALKGAHGETYEDGSKYAAKWVDVARSVAPAPFSTLWYTRAAMDYLVWSKLKEELEPGSIRRTERRLKKEFNQESMLRRTFGR